jgi:hypothetical protein
MPPGITFDVLKRMGSPLSGARVPLLSPHRASVTVGRPPPPSTSVSASTAPVDPQAACGEPDGVISPPLHASNLPSGSPMTSRASMPTLTPRARQSTLDRDSVEGIMMVQLKREKKKRKQLLPAAKASYYVVSDASKPVIEIYTYVLMQPLPLASSSSVLADGCAGRTRGPRWCICCRWQAPR